MKLKNKYLIKGAKSFKDYAEIFKIIRSQVGNEHSYSAVGSVVRISTNQRLCLKLLREKYEVEEKLFKRSFRKKLCNLLCFEN